MTTAHSTRRGISRGLDLLLIPLVWFVILVRLYEFHDLHIFILVVALIYSLKNLFLDPDAGADSRIGVLDVSVVAVVLVEGISCFASTYRANSVHFLVEVLFLFLFYYVVRTSLRHGYQRMGIYLGLSAMGLWVSSRALYSFWRHNERLSALGFENAADFKHLFGLVGPPGYATGERITMLLLFLPFPLILLLTLNRGKVIRWFLLVPAASVVAALLVTFSRAVYAAVFVFVSAASMLLYRYRLLSAKRIALVGMLIAVPTVALLIPVTKPVLTTASLLETESQVRSIEGRLHIWRASIEMAKQRPWTGVGAYNFPMHYSGYDQDHSTFVASSFNYFLQILVEKGLLGLLAYLALLVIFFRTGVQALRASTSEANRIASVLFLAGVASVIVRDLTYSSLFINKTAGALLWLILACIAPSRNQQVARRFPLFPVAAALVVAVLSVLVAGDIGKSRVAEGHFKEFIPRLAAGDYAEAREQIDKAIQASPSNAYYLASRGLLSERSAAIRLDPDQLLSRREIETRGAREALKEAADYYARAMALNADDPVLHHNLGWVYLLLGDVESALERLSAAARMDPGNALFHLSVGLCHERLHMNQEALASYLTAIRMSPAILDSRFYADFGTRLPDEAERLVTDCIGAVEARLSETGDPMLRAQLGKLYLHAGRPEAFGSLQRTTGDLPNLPRPWLYLGALNQERGRYDEARRCYDRAVFLDSGDYFAFLHRARLHDILNRGSEAIDDYESAVNRWLTKVSTSARRAARVYLAANIVPDDVVPAGLLAYAQPDPDFPGMCKRLADLYRASGDAARADYYERLSRQPSFQ